MSEGHRQSRIRLLRRRAGLSQRDLAALLGYRSHSQISRYENGRRVPSVDELLQIQVVFGVVPSGVFPHLHERAAQTVVARINKLIQQDRNAPARMRSGQPSRKAAHFRRVLDSIRDRISPGLSAHEPWPTATTLDETEPEEL